MRLLYTLFLTTALAPLASAHTLDGDATLYEELGHQLSSGHHLPLVLAVVAVALVLHRGYLKNRR
jgi:hypothetical protein